MKIPKYRTKSAYSVKAEPVTLLCEQYLQDLFFEYVKADLSGMVAIKVFSPAEALSLSRVFDVYAPGFYKEMNESYSPISGDWLVALSSFEDEHYMMFLTNRPDTITGMKNWDGQLSSLDKDKDVTIVKYKVHDGIPVFDKNGIKRLLHMQWVKKATDSYRTEPAEKSIDLSSYYGKGFFDPKNELSVSVDLGNIIEQYNRSLSSYIDIQNGNQLCSFL